LRTILIHLLFLYEIDHFYKLIMRLFYIYSTITLIQYGECNNFCCNHANIKVTHFLLIYIFYTICMNINIFCKVNTFLRTIICFTTHLRGIYLGVMRANFYFRKDVGNIKWNKSKSINRCKQYMVML